MTAYNRLLNLIVEIFEKFNGSNFKCWQQKMLFYLTTLSVTKFLKKDVSSYKEDEIIMEKLVVVDA